MINLGKVQPGSTIYVPFETFAGSTGAPITLTGLATSDILVYKDGGTTQRASASGFTLLDTDGIDFDGITGIHGFSIDLSDNTTADFWASGSKYFVVVSTVTVDSQTMSFIAAMFSIGEVGAILDTTIASLSSQTSFTLTAGPAEDDALNGRQVVIHDAASAVQQSFGIVLDYTGSTKTVTLAIAPTFTIAAKDNISFMLMQPLQPTTAGNTLDVTSTGEAGLDWGNIANKTTTNALTNTTIAATQQVDVNTIKTQAVTCASGVTINVNVGTTQPLNFTGTAGSALVKSDMVDIAGAAVSTSSAQIGVNVVQAGATAWGSGAITAASIAADAITAAKVADGTIDAATFAAGAINAAAIASDAITDAKVASDVTIASVTGSVGSVASGGISSASFAAGAITASAIAADAIGASELAADAVAEIQSGLSTLDASGVRAAVGLASANLDTQIDALPTNAELATALGTADDATLTAVAAIATTIGVAGAGLTGIPQTGYKLAADGADLIVPADPSAIPVLGTASIVTWIGYFGAWTVNEVNSDSNSVDLRNSADNANLASHATSDDGTTFSSGEPT